jgi:hypothetical protein
LFIVLTAILASLSPLEVLKDCFKLLTLLIEPLVESFDLFGEKREIAFLVIKTALNFDRCGSRLWGDGGLGVVLLDFAVSSWGPFLA